MDFEEFREKLEELLADAEIHIHWPLLAEVLRNKADALEEAHGR